MKKISTIIPNFNNSFWLPHTLDSVLSQKGNFEQEVIVVDDHSSDDSWSILKDYKKRYFNRFFFYKNEGKGGNSARNFGYSKSTGDYIQWLDSDDQILPDKFDHQSKYLVNHPEVDIVYSDWRMDFYENGKKFDEKIKLENNNSFFLKKLILDEWLPPLSYMLKREMADKLDLISAWNPNRKVAQDREYFTLAAIQGANFNYVPGLFSVYNRWDTKSVSSIDFMKRLELSLELEELFMDKIANETWIEDDRKKELLSYLKTDSLKACFYHPSLMIKKPVKFNEIEWNRIHYKMKPIIPFIWLWQNLKLKSKSSD